MKKFTLKPIAGENLRLVEPGRLTVPYKTDLNPSQYDAVTSLDGPHLVIAGAGTGKTRTIVYRVAYLVERGVPPNKVLLLTFTRRAAQEMLRRAAILLDQRCEHVSGGTFHSFANGVLRKYAHLLGYDRTFTILDQSDSEDVVNLLRTRLRLDTREKRFPRKETLHDLFSRAVNTITPVQDLIARDLPQFLEQEKDIVGLLQAYVVYKRSNNLMDYDDLLVNLTRLFQEHPSVRKALNDQYSYVMVDEYQDTNRIQAEIVRGLAGERRNLMVVGDDAQCIYSFRGSTIRNILSFPEEYPGCRVVKIEENYRSTQPILNLANELLLRGMPAPPEKSGGEGG